MRANLEWPVNFGLIVAFLVAASTSIACQPDTRGEEDSLLPETPIEIEEDPLAEEQETPAPPVENENDREAMAAMVEAQIERPVGSSDCLRRTDTFDEIIVYGSFASGLGCIFAMLYFNGEWYRDVRQGVSQVLRARGWRELPPSQRQELAEAAVMEIFTLYRSSLVERPHRAFEFDDTPDYAPLRNTVNDDDEVVILAWTQMSRGRSQTQGFNQMMYVFGPGGDIEVEDVDGFRIDVARLR